MYTSLWVTLALALALGTEGVRAQSCVTTHALQVNGQFVVSVRVPIINTPPPVNCPCYNGAPWILGFVNTTLAPAPTSIFTTVVPFQYGGVAHLGTLVINSGYGMVLLFDGAGAMLPFSNCASGIGLPMPLEITYMVP